MPWQVLRIADHVGVASFFAAFRSMRLDPGADPLYVRY
jgi:hypothetical protein